MASPTLNHPTEPPDRIDISSAVYALLVGTYYVVKFPYNAAAVALMKSYGDAQYERSSSGWTVSAHRIDSLKSRMIEIDAIVSSQAVPSAKVASKSPSKQDRSVVLVATAHQAGDIIETKKGPVTIDRFGAIFLGDSRLAKWGKADHIGKPLRYAYHHPSTEAELKARDDKVAEARHVPEEEASHEPF